MNIEQKIEDEILPKLTQETCKSLNLKKKDLSELNWQTGESNLDTDFSKLYLYEYFDNTYKYDFDNHVNIHSSKILIEFFQNRDFVIQEVKLDKKNFSIFQSSYIKLYLIKKYR